MKLYIIILLLFLSACSWTQVKIERKPDGTFIGEYYRSGDQTMSGLSIENMFGADIEVDKKQNSGMTTEELKELLKILR